MKSNFKIKIILTVLILFSSSMAQNNKTRFLQLPLDKGVSLNLTYDMIQDSKGFLWFGTMYGLVKYDGENYTTYKYNPDNTSSISFDDVVSIYEDSKGNLWIGTWGGGLNMFDTEKKIFKRFLHNPDNRNSIADNIIWSVCEDRDGMIWIGTGSGGLQVFNPASGEFKNINLKLNDSTHVYPSIQDLYADDNLIWVGHSKGLSSFNLRTTNIDHFNLNETNMQSTGNLFVNAIFKDSKDNLWLGTSNGLKRYDKFEQKFVQHKNDLQFNITSIAEDKEGNLWIGSNNGLIKLNSYDSDLRIFESNTRNSIAGNYVNRVLVDNSGIIWAASYNAGITKIILSPSKFNLLQSNKDDPNSLSYGNIQSIAEDEKSNIYIGSYGSKINVYNSGNDQLSIINLPQQGFMVVQSLAVHKNNLWIGAGNSLLKYDLNRKRFANISLIKEEKNEIEGKSITALCFDAKDNLWIGTYNQGIYRLDEEEKTLKHFSFSEEQNLSHTDFILSIYSDSKNNIWIGTYGGVYQFDLQTEKFKSYIQNQNNPTGLSNNYVYSILEDRRGNIWFGTASGLNRFELKTNSFRHFYQQDGLPSDVIFGIVEDNVGNIWLSTNKGVSRYNLTDNSFLNFDKDDGLQGNVFNPAVYSKSSDGTVYFGGMNGVSFFNPNNLIFSEYNPQVVITSIKIKNEDGNFTETNINNDVIELEPDQNSIIIEFASLDFTNPEKNEYQYKLFGYNEDWLSLNGDNSVIFSRLPHGNYSFQLMGTNSDGVWSENFASISFVITPHFYQTWWFVPSVMIGSVLILFLAYLLVLKTKVSRAIKIQTIKEEESNRIRKKTAIDFHDELGHRLTRISLLTEIVKRKIGVSFSEINPLLNQISENSARLYDGTKDFIWAIDPQKDSLYELIIRLKDFGDEIFSSTNVNFNVEGISEEFQNASLDMDWKRHLMMIFKEGMNNSLKHSNSKTVSLTSSIKEEEFEIMLEDDGAGFEMNENFKGNGLKNMQKRAEILNAKVQIDSKPGSGTKLLFKGKFPIKSVNFN
jgi:ligand-binding sensor domain-containing protein/signal transduction histidine kinase